MPTPPPLHRFSRRLFTPDRAGLAACGAVFRPLAKRAPDAFRVFSASCAFNRRFNVRACFQAGLTAALLVATQLASAGEPPPSGTRADSALDIAIVIPPLLRILEDDHPQHLPNASAPAVQRVVLVSTLRSGFCIDLRLRVAANTGAAPNHWQVSLAAPSAVRLESAGGGWRACARRAGRYEVALQHEFNGAAAPAGRSWPVALSLTTP